MKVLLFQKRMSERDDRNHRYPIDDVALDAVLEKAMAGDQARKGASQEGEETLDGVFGEAIGPLPVEAERGYRYPIGDQDLDTIWERALIGVSGRACGLSPSTGVWGKPKVLELPPVGMEAARAGQADDLLLEAWEYGHKRRGHRIARVLLAVSLVLLFSTFSLPPVRAVTARIWDRLFFTVEVPLGQSTPPFPFAVVLRGMEFVLVYEQTEENKMMANYRWNGYAVNITIRKKTAETSDVDGVDIPNTYVQQGDGYEMVCWQDIGGNSHGIIQAGGFFLECHIMELSDGGVFDQVLFHLRIQEEEEEE